VKPPVISRFAGVTYPPKPAPKKKRKAKKEEAEDE